jgi:DNA-binding NarL/FixJ family response regulator
MDKLSIKIFIVDDSLKFRKAIKEFLRMKGYSCIVGEASNGEELLEKLKYKDIDIILLDINIPKINGIEIAKIINQKYRDNTRIIALSYYDDFLYMKCMIEAGALGYVVKSEVGNQLNLAISKVMEGKFYYPELM